MQFLVAGEYFAGQVSGETQQHERGGDGNGEFQLGGGNRRSGVEQGAPVDAPEGHLQRPLQQWKI